MELIVGSAMTLSFIAICFLWARKAYRDGYMEGLKDSKLAFDMMMARGQIVPGPASYEDVQSSGDYGDLPKPSANKKAN